jgi:hypothetical protein
MADQRTNREPGREFAALNGTQREAATHPRCRHRRGNLRLQRFAR